MTRPVPGYATPALAVRNGTWHVTAQPWGAYVGQIIQHDAGWTGHTPRGAYVGLFPDKQAAAEALVKHAGYGLMV